MLSDRYLNYIRVKILENIHLRAHLQIRFLDPRKITRQAGVRNFLNENLLLHRRLVSILSINILLVFLSIRTHTSLFPHLRLFQTYLLVYFFIYPAVKKKKSPRFFFAAFHPVRRPVFYRAVFSSLLFLNYRSVGRYYPYMGLVHFQSRSPVQHKVGPERWAETCGVKDGGSFVISDFVVRFLRWFFQIFCVVSDRMFSWSMSPSVFLLQVGLVSYLFSDL